MLNQVLAFALLVACWWLGEVLAQTIPLPGPLLGLLLLFSLLVLRRRVPASLNLVSKLLIGHLALFFVPATVAILLFKRELAEHGLSLIIAIVGSTVLAMAITAWVGQRMLGSKEHG